jgi:hypothetical protein
MAITVELLREKIAEMEENKKRLVAQLNYSEGAIQGFLGLIEAMQGTDEKQEPIKDNNTVEGKKK